jgi:hypothetical protein
VVKIVLGPSVVVCRLIFKETSAPKNTERKKRIGSPPSWMSLCIRGMISYDGCVMMSSDIPTASHPITIFAACFFFFLPSFLALFDFCWGNRFLRYWRQQRAGLFFLY